MNLFIDIETIKDKLSPELQTLRDEKYKEKSGESYGLFAEFGKILCISIGYEYEGKFNIKSFTGTEKEILESFLGIIKKNTILVGHNLIGFDLPFITKRAIINGFEIPEAIKTYGKKPWEIKHLDTMLMWKHTSRTNTSLDLLCGIFNIESPKNGDVCGANLQEFYDKDIKPVLHYGQRDSKVLAVEYGGVRYEVKAGLTDPEFRKFIRKSQKKYKINLITEYCEKDVISTYKVFKCLEKSLGV